MNKLAHPPTEEQSAILELANSQGNLMIEAFAGTGKTSTLEMFDSAIKRQPHLYLVFNKANASEAEKRMASTTTTRTFNSLGHRIWAQACARNLSLNTRKINEIFRGVIEEYPKASRDALWSSYDLVTAGVNLARALGYIPSQYAKASSALIHRNAFHSLLDESPSDDEADLIDEILLRSIKLAYEGTIDFNDQIYMPAFFGGTYPTFPVVLVDEYQDLSPSNHAMLAKLCKSSRQIGVGDDAQSIYGFRGAKAGGITQAIQTYSMSKMPLSISFRCPSAIVANVHWRVPTFTAFKQGGKVANRATGFNASELRDGAAIICRNNAPLMAAAFGCIIAGHSVSLAGTDIGPRLITTMRKLGPESMTRGETIAAIEDWLLRKLEKESKTAEDTAACMRIFAEQGSTLGQALAYAEHLFAQTGTIRLMTGHKAKGLEFDHVYHLDRQLLRDTQQDLNLAYVVDTRARESLTYISSETIEWR